MNINWFQWNLRQTTLDAFIILKGVQLKNVTYTTSGVTLFVSNVKICGPVIAYL